MTLDHLYLDVNGILHRCSKDESVLFKKFVQGKSMKQIMTAIIDYMDYLVKVVRPRKSLFIAIDGVAPRAKMTSQKKERYKKQKTDKSVDEFLKKILGNENDLLEFKSGTISPGTEFMCKLRAYTDFYIKKKFAEDPFWKKLNVVFSGGDVPGEGEHKILEYIRRMKQTKEFNSSESHCIYSNDADLIMLSLATHLPYVSILRETMQFSKANVNLVATRNSEKPPLEFLYVNLLREYIDLEYRAIQEDLPMPYRLEKIIDDWVLLCFFIGNDFLRKIYCLNVRKGNFDEIIEIFKETFGQTKEYSLREGHINWDNFYCLLKNISRLELKLIQGAKEELMEYSKEIHDTERMAIQRLQNQEQELENEAKKKIMELPGDPHIEVLTLPPEEEKEGGPTEEDLKSFFSGFGISEHLSASDVSESTMKKSIASDKEVEIALNIESIEKTLALENSYEISMQKQKERSPFEEVSKSGFSEPSEGKTKKKGLTTQFRSDVVENEKKFVEMIERLYYEGKQHDGKRAYYKRFFGFDINEEEGQCRLRTVIKNYLEGVQFVISYYYDGCPSWTWYNKYALSPFLSDVVEFLETFGQEIRKEYEFNFEYSGPADPFLQLLLIISPESSSLLPPEFRGIMNDPSSPAIRFYPTEFEMTPLDTKLDYAWIPLLPPVDDKVIESEYKRVKDEVWSKLSSEVQLRNNKGIPFKYSYNPSVELEVRIEESGLVLEEFTNFTTPVELTPFDYMESLKFDKEFSKHALPKAMKINRHFPSFGSFGLLFNQRLVQKRTRAGVAYHVLILEGFEQKDSIVELVEKTPNQEGMFYFGYPIQEPGYVGYVLSEKGPLSFSNFHPGTNNPVFDNYEYPQMFHNICKDVRRQYLTNFGIDLGKIKELVLMEHINGCYRNHSRECDPFYSCNINWEKMIPGAFVTNKVLTYQQMMYPLKDQVLWDKTEDIVLSVQCGSLCKVLRNGELLDKNKKVEIEYLKSDNTNSVKIRPAVMESSAKFHKVDHELLMSMGIPPRFYGVLWLLLESFIVQTDTSRDSYFILGQGFNMGLRAMDVFQIAPKFMAVPDLVKIVIPKNPRGFGDKTSAKSTYKYKIFKKPFRGKPGNFFEFDVRLSDQTVNLIKNYVIPSSKEHPYNSALINYLCQNYFTFFDNDHTLTRIPILKAVDIFKHSNLKESHGDPNMKLMDIYLWAISQDESSYPLMNSLSLIANRNIIHKIEEKVNSKASQKSSLTRELVDEASIVKLNKSLHLAMVPLSEHPPVHLPGDRVICLNYQFPALLPFGMQATVVGIYKTQIEIVTDKPVIGGTSLGGGCSFFHGFTVSFEDVFNFKWKTYLFRGAKEYYVPWLGDLDLGKIKAEQIREIIEADKRAIAEKQQRHQQKEEVSYKKAEALSKPQPKLYPKEAFRRGKASNETEYEPVSYVMKKPEADSSEKTGYSNSSAPSRSGNRYEPKKESKCAETDGSQKRSSAEATIKSEVSTLSILEAISIKELERAEEKKFSMLDKIKSKTKEKSS